MKNFIKNKDDYLHRLFEKDRSMNNPRKKMRETYSFFSSVIIISEGKSTISTVSFFTEKEKITTQNFRNLK